MPRHIALLALALVLFPTVALGTTYVVAADGTGDFPTILAAIEAAVEGDTIELGDGIFQGDGNRDLDFGGKSLTLRSQSGNPQACVIDCQGSEADPHRGFDFRSHQEPEAIIQGITITNGYAWGEH
jgi:hypothetical protein